MTNYYSKYLKYKKKYLMAKSNMRGGSSNSLEGWENGNKINLMEDKDAQNVLKNPDKFFEFRIAEEVEAVESGIEGKEGVHSAEKGDSIMTGSQNENWVIKAEVFKETYNIKSGIASEKLNLDESFKFRIAEGVETIETGSEDHPNATKGDYIMTGWNGENWVISAKDFEEKYNIKSGLASKKPIPVLAKQMQNKFFVKVVWQPEPVRGDKGDWLVQNGPDDSWLVDNEAFKDTYKILEEHKLANGTTVLKDPDGTLYDPNPNLVGKLDKASNSNF